MDVTKQCINRARETKLNRTALPATMRHWSHSSRHLEKSLHMKLYFALSSINVVQSDFTRRGWIACANCRIRTYINWYGFPHVFSAFLYQPEVAFKFNLQPTIEHPSNKHSNYKALTYWIPTVATEFLHHRLLLHLGLLSLGHEMCLHFKEKENKILHGSI